MIRAFFIFILIVLSSQFCSITAQQYQLSSENKKALKHYKTAELAYRQNELTTAVESLEKAVKKDPEFIEAWLLLGDSFSELSQKDDAIVAYNEAIRIEPDFFPQAYYFLGKLSYELGDYQKAEQYLEEFLNFSEITQERKQLGKMTLERAKFSSHALQNPTGPHPENIGDSINTLEDEYINFVDETLEELILTRKINRETGKKHGRLFAEGFYNSILKNHAYSQATIIALSWQENLDIGGMSLSVDGRKMYFAGCQWPNGFGSCDLYVSFHGGLSWESPSNLGTAINSQWWDSQPVISADEKQLYFSSKRNGGKGGADIWKSIKLPNGKWSPPINLGDSINTSGDEMAPFLHADGKTLYFSSTARLGLGGYDLFISRKDITGQWSEAKNLGYPVNTKDNEINIFISLAGTHAWVSSDRKGGKGGFDIYGFQTNEQIRPEKVLFVKGVVMDAESGRLLDAKIDLTNLLNNRIENSKMADPLSGEFLMVLHQGDNYAFNITKKGYLFYSRNLDVNRSDTAKYTQQIFKLVPIKQGKKTTLNNVFFDFNSSKLKVSSNTELNKLLEMLQENKGLNILIAGHTDGIGNPSYNESLSTDRALAVYDFLISKGIDKNRLEYIGFGATKPVRSNASEEGRKKNRRTEIIVL